jgi:hypothetical protein
LEECAKLLTHGNKIQFYHRRCYGLCFWRQIQSKLAKGNGGKNLESHVRIEVIVVVDEDGKRVITAVETGVPYASEVKMLKKRQRRLRHQRK